MQIISGVCKYTAIELVNLCVSCKQFPTSCDSYRLHGQQKVPSDALITQFNLSYACCYVVKKIATLLKEVPTHFHVHLLKTSSIFVFKMTILVGDYYCDF